MGLSLQLGRHAIIGQKGKPGHHILKGLHQHDDLVLAKGCKIHLIARKGSRIIKQMM